MSDGFEQGGAGGMCPNCWNNPCTCKKPERPVQDREDIDEDTDEGKPADGTAEAGPAGITPEDIREKKTAVVAAWLKERIEGKVNSNYYSGHQCVTTLLEALEVIGEMVGYTIDQQQMDKLAAYDETSLPPSFGNPDNFEAEDYDVSGHVDFMGRRILEYSCGGDGYGFSTDWQDAELERAVTDFLDLVVQ